MNLLVYYLKEFNREYLSTKADRRIFRWHLFTLALLLALLLWWIVNWPDPVVQVVTSIKG